MSSADLPLPDEPGSFDMRDVLQLVARFQRAWTSEPPVDDGNLLPAALSRAAMRVLGADGAGISMMTEPSYRLPLGASDTASATAERLQFTVGEGPCFTAYAQGRPVVVTEAGMTEQWPVLASLHFDQTPFRGGLSIPLHVGGTRLGVLDLYLHRSRPVDGHEVVAAQLIAEHLGEALVGTLTGSETEDAFAGHLELTPRWLTTERVRARRDVWVAVGMANLVLGVPGDEALALLRARAVSEGHTLDALAHDVVVARYDVADLLPEQ